MQRIKLDESDIAKCICGQKGIICKAGKYKGGHWKRYYISCRDDKCWSGPQVKELWKAIECWNIIMKFI